MLDMGSDDDSSAIAILRVEFTRPAGNHSYGQPRQTTCRASRFIEATELHFQVLEQYVE